MTTHVAIITSLVPNEQLSYTFYHPGYGYPDEPVYYNTVVYRLQPEGAGTVLNVGQGDFSVFTEGEVFLGTHRAFGMRLFKS